MNKKTKKIAKAILDSFEIVETSQTHRLWKQQQEMQKKYHLIAFRVGKTQYFFESDKGCISMIKIHSLDKGYDWEIYCMKGKLFEDVIRFKTEKSARKKIKELLK